MRIILTGGAGFIGSAVIRHLIGNTTHQVFNVDKLTYAGDLSTIAAVSKSDRYLFQQADICDKKTLQSIFSEYKPDKVMHLAAESHVDRSIDGPAAFIETNIVGTYAMLDVARQYWNQLAGNEQNNFRFHHISTDEVYGSLGAEGCFTETTAYEPTSPYSSSKASSDHLVRAWYHTYGFPSMVTNCSNNYGPYQFPEKLIPLIILKAFKGEELPVYGKGDNVRDWLHVEDHARALILILENGKSGDTYNIGGKNEKTNLEVVNEICRLLDEKLPDKQIGPRQQLIRFVSDRPGHDFRYAIDASKIEKELAWSPQESFESGLTKTVEWYLENMDWVNYIESEKYQGQRLGSGNKKYG